MSNISKEVLLGESKNLAKIHFEDCVQEEGTRHKKKILFWESTLLTASYLVPYDTLLQNATGYCYKMRQLFYSKMRQSFIIKYMKYFLPKYISLITKCDSY